MNNLRGNASKSESKLSAFFLGELVADQGAKMMFER